MPVVLLGRARFASPPPPPLHFPSMDWSFYCHSTMPQLQLGLGGGCFVLFTAAISVLVYHGLVVAKKAKWEGSTGAELGQNSLFPGSFCCHSSALNFILSSSSEKQLLLKKGGKEKKKKI